MNEVILKTSRLSNKYFDVTMLNSVNMQIKKGEIYGLIGKNGSGKSTLIKVILGLIYPNDGEIKLFGEYTKAGLEKSRKRIGALIEKPCLIEDMTVYKNLEFIRIQRGIPNKYEVNEKLELLNLQNEAHKNIKKLSLGMKQRLGIAMAMIGDPEFLILDEPINGLDSISMIKIRELLLSLNKKKNVTILITSHILGELEKIATNYGVIDKGRLIDEFTKEELEKKCESAIEVKVDNINKAVLVIENELKSTNFKVLPNNIVKIYDYIDNPIKVSSILSKNNIGIEKIVATKGDLESYFINLIGGEDLE